MIYYDLVQKHLVVNSLLKLLNHDYDVKIHLLVINLLKT